MAWRLTITHADGVTEQGGWPEGTAKRWRDYFGMVSGWQPGWVKLAGVEIRTDTITAVTATEE